MMITSYFYVSYRKTLLENILYALLFIMQLCASRNVYKTLGKQGEKIFFRVDFSEDRGDENESFYRECPPCSFRVKVRCLSTPLLKRGYVHEPMRGDLRVLFSPPYPTLHRPDFGHLRAAESVWFQGNASGRVVLRRVSATIADSLLLRHY